ncbi:MAG: PKD domain-containing protein, partial [Bacteroidota bacterium]
STAQVTIALQPGYYDDFIFDFSWTASNTATTGAWVRAVPVGTTYNSAPSNPGADVNGDYSTQCLVTGNGGGAAGDYDVDGGTTTITSPAMDLSGYTNPVVRYYRWFYNGGGSGTPNDSLVISLVNGTQIIDIDKVGQGANSNQWTYKSYRVKDYIANPGNNIYFRARTFDLASSGHLVEGGIDLFRVIDSSGISFQPPTANFASNITSVCVGGQVAFNDLSSNSPTSWAWTFPGGSPAAANSANPIITYTTPGIYNVSLTVTNNGGFNSTTQNSYIKVDAVVAQFSQDKQGICAGQSVTFTSETSCNPTIIKWIFNGGDIDTS